MFSRRGVELPLAVGGPQILGESPSCAWSSLVRLGKSLVLESWSGEPAPSRALPSPEVFVVFMAFAAAKDGFETFPVFGSTGVVCDVVDPERVIDGCD